MDTSDMKVRAPIADPGRGSLRAETLHALQDPADEDQAVIANVPVFIDTLNHGDLVRIGPEENGTRPVLSVVIVSGHRHFLIFLPADGAELACGLPCATAITFGSRGA